MENGIISNVDLAGNYKRLMRFFWDPEPKNDDPGSGSIWCLGREYSGYDEPTETNGAEDTERGVAMSDDHCSDKETVMISTRQPEVTEFKSIGYESEVIVPQMQHTSDDGEWPRNFLEDFESRLWFTYRSHFPPISKSTDPGASSSLSLAVRLRSQLVDQTGFTSDTGWGCMIRSGQCLIANALQILQFGRDWRRGNKLYEEKALLCLFSDDMRAPFSLHRFVQHGATACGKHPGEWFGPSATARCIQALSQAFPDCGLNVYMTGDGADIYEDAFYRIAKPPGSNFSPVLVLVGIRLGIDRVNPVYWEALKKTLKLPQSIGIAGGRPSASHYFVGVQGDHFFFLDPHQTRPMLAYHERTEAMSDEEVNSCHTGRLRRLHIQSMDPSMLIGFLIQSEEDWRNWKSSINTVEGKPVLHIADNEPPSPYLHGPERSSALDEVETFDDEDL